MCEYCGKLARARKACQRCFHANYCNQECQRAAWKAHKPVCKALCEHAARLREENRKQLPFIPFLYMKHIILVRSIASAHWSCPLRFRHALHKHTKPLHWYHDSIMCIAGVHVRSTLHSRTVHSCVLHESPPATPRFIACACAAGSPGPLPLLAGVPRQRARHDGAARSVPATQAAIDLPLEVHVGGSARVPAPPAAARGDRVGAASEGRDAGAAVSRWRD
jgi:MYND finger